MTDTDNYAERMQNSIKMSTTTALIALLICNTITACDNSWPPRKDNMIEHFEKHRTGIEVLEEEFAKTEYLRMSIGLEGQARADAQGEKYIESKVLKGEIGEEWHQLLLNAGVNSVFRGDDYKSFEIYLQYGGDISGITEFVHAPRQERVLKECKDEYSKLRCGWCAVSLDNHWHISASWYDSEPNEEATKAFMNNEISFEEYEKLYDVASDACEAKGREVIGYPLPESESRLDDNWVRES